MRRLLLAVTAAIGTSCAVTTSQDTPERNTAWPTTASLTSGDIHELDERWSESEADDTLLRFDVRIASEELTTSSPDDARTNKPQDDKDTKSAHDNDPMFLGPLPRSTRPNPAGDLMPILRWLGTALLNTESNHRLNAADLSLYLAPALAAAHEPAGHRLPPTGNGDSHRAVLLDARIDDETSTSTLVNAILTYERTSGTGVTPLPGFELVTLTITAQHTESGWQIIALQVSAA